MAPQCEEPTPFDIRTILLRILDAIQQTAEATSEMRDMMQARQ